MNGLQPHIVESDKYDLAWISTDGLDRQDCLKWTQNILSLTELQRLQRLSDSMAQREFATSRYLLRQLLSRWCPKVEPADWIFGNHDSGKPFIQNPPQSISLSLSHTKGFVACAVSKHPAVGIDVENVNQRRNIDKIATAYFLNSEVATLSGLEPKDRNNLFFQYWTLKEAYYKAVGTGLQLRDQPIGFEVSSSDQVTLTTGANPLDWDLQLLRPLPHVQMAIAVQLR